ncbi:MAG: competence/damage-inducible protein A [Pseudomonadales bacterium]|nr:competence/damage-inducible protein A [Pseudomonadales bacterium]
MRTVTAAVLIIGNEILSGRTQDTNLNHLALTLGEWGIQVREARVVPDIESTIVATLNELRPRFDYVFTTGGIGPTHDDITADCVAKAFGVPLVESETIAARIRQRPAPPDIMASRLRMARIPDGATLIENNTGGPQGFRIGNVHVFAGIPMVMRAMLETLENTLEHGLRVRSCSVVAPVGESQIATAFGEVQARYPDLDLGSYPFFRQNLYGTNLVIRGTDPARLRAALDEVKAIIVAAGAEPGDESFE